LGAGQSIEDRAFADIGQTYYSDAQAHVVSP